MKFSVVLPLPGEEEEKIMDQSTGRKNARRRRRRDRGSSLHLV